MLHLDQPPLSLKTPGGAPSRTGGPALGDKAREEEVRRDISLGDVFGAVRRRKWTVLVIAVLTVLLAAVFVTTSTRLYQADIVLVLETREKSVVSLDSVVSGLSGEQSVVNTEMAVLSSRNLLTQVVEELDLTSDPEFNPALREVPAWREYLSLGALKAWIAGLFGGDGEGAAAREPDPTDEAVAILLRKLSVTVQPQSLVFVIRVETEDPEKSARIANLIGETYIRDQQAIKFEETARATEWLSEQVLELKEELEAAEAAVERYSLSSTLVSEEALALQSRQIKELRDRLDDLRTQRAEDTSPLAAIEALRAAPGDIAAASVLANGEALRLATEIAGLDESDPDRAALVAALEAALDRLARPLRAAAIRLDGQIAALEESIAAQAAEIDRQSADLVALRQLTREAEASRLIYEYFLTRMKETSIQQGISEADARIISGAVIPIRPFFPRTGLTLILALIGGLILGAGVVVLRWQLDTRFRTPEELERFTGADVYGAIPLAATRRRGRVLRYVIDKPSSALAEAVRDFRTSLLMADADHPPQVVLISSASPADGKTTTAALLAHINATLGKKVLLMECDLRRPTFPQAFGIRPERGITDFLAGNMPVAEVVYRDEGSGIDLLFAQEAGINPSDVFSSRRFAEAMRELRATYDFIVVDSPPVLAVPDARIIARHADALVVCAAWRRATKAMVRAVVRQFSSIRVRMAGFVMTKVDRTKLARDGYGEYASYYGASKAYYRN